MLWDVDLRRPSIPGRPPRVKICGVSCVEDAQWLGSFPIDAIGLNFHPKSPRYVDPQVARRIADALPASMEKVGVFVDRPVAAIRQIAREAGLTAIQLHGSEPLNHLVELAEFRLLRAVRVRGPETFEVIAGMIEALDAMPQRLDVGLLLDSYRPGEPGGTGTTWDWSLVGDLLRARPTYLAGGLTPQNVGQAIQEAKPFGIDLASGVETSPGRKDRQKVEELFSQIARAESDSR